MDVYKQTTEYTCAACSLLTVLHHTKQVPLSREMEFTIWQKVTNLPTRAPSIYGLALVAKEYGLTPRILLEEKEYDYPDYRFKGYTKKEIDEAKFSSKLYAKKAREQGIPIEERALSIKDVKEMLKDKIILLRVNAGVFRDTGSTSKYVAVIASNNNFLVADPRQGTIEVSEEKLNDAMITLQTKKKRDVRLIVFD